MVVITDENHVTKDVALIPGGFRAPSGWHVYFPVTEKPPSIGDVFRPDVIAQPWLNGDDDVSPKFRPCCPAWRQAHDERTDNEGFMPLISYTDDDDADTRPRTGVGYGESVLPPLRFCPWCGVEKTPNHEHSRIPQQQ